MFRIKDSSQKLREPTEEEKKFFCKPLTSDCTAIVLVPDNSSVKPCDNNGPKGRIAEMVKELENQGASKRMQNRTHYKEKGIVIKVKKNQEQAKLYSI